MRRGYKNERSGEGERSQAPAGSVNMIIPGDNLYALKTMLTASRAASLRLRGGRAAGRFHFYKLGCPIFDEEGQTNPDVLFTHLAAHV